MKSAFTLMAALTAASILLEGCAVYEPQAYNGYPYYQSAPVYVEPGYGYYSQPAPIYTVPPPVYVGPPVRFSFNFGYWSGGGHGWGGHHHHWNGAHRWGGLGWGGHHHHR